MFRRYKSFSMRRCENDNEVELPATSAPVKTSSAMKSASAVKPATKTRLSAEGIRPNGAAMVKTAERTGVRGGLAVWGRKPMLRTCECSCSRTVMTAADVASEIVSINECSAVGNVRIVVIDDRVVMPVESPMMPSPAKAAEVANSKAYTEGNCRAADENSGDWIPSGPHR
jgi:hypothetical protein